MLKLIKSPVTFYEFTHNYLTPEGTILLGVTSLMKKHGLSADYTGIPENILQRAADKGTALHELLEAYDNGETVKQTADLAAYAAMKKEKNLQVDCSEYLISNDIVASKIDKVLSDCSLADVKHTSTLHVESVRWQLSIYAAMFEAQNPGLNVPHLYAFHIRDGRAKCLELKRIETAEIDRLMQCEREGTMYTPVAVEVPEFRDMLTPVETQQYIDNIAKLQEFKVLCDKIEEQQKLLNQKLYENMEKSGIKKLETNDFMLTYVAPTTRSSIDSAKLKKDLPDIAAKYTKISNIAGSLRFTYKN